MRRVSGGYRCGRGAGVASQNGGGGWVGRCIGSLDEHQAVTNNTAVSVNVLKAQVGVVVEVELSVAVVDLVENSGDVESRVSRAVAFNVSSSTVDDVSYCLSRVREVCVVVDNGRVVNGVVTDREHSLIPMNVSRLGFNVSFNLDQYNYHQETDHVSINTILEQKTLESVADVLLVGRNFGRVHGPVRHSNDPWGSGAVNLGEILLEPLNLAVGGIVAPAPVDSTEWTRIGNEGFALLRESLILAADITGERPLRRVSKVSLTIKRNEVGISV